MWYSNRTMRARNRYLPRVEALETRLNPGAGTVVATISSRGDVTLTGDVFDNEISLSIAGDTLTVTGTGTLLDGPTFKDEATANFTNFRNVIVDLLSNADSVTVATADFQNNLTINTGIGDDTITLGDLAGTLLVEGSILVNADRGDDTIVITNPVVVGNILVNAGEGNNSATFTGSATATDVNAFGRFSYTGGSGKETISCGFNVRGNMEFRNGAGVNTTTITAVTTGGGLVIYGGNGDDTVTVADSTLRASAAIILGNGDNTTTVDGCLVERALNISNGSGQDNVTLSGQCIFANTVTILGGQNDTATVTAVEFFNNLLVRGSENVAISDTGVQGDLQIVLGNSNNIVTIGTTNIDGNFSIVTGAGNDDITITDCNVGLFTTMQTYAGNDSVTVNGGEFNQPFVIRTGAGNDNVRIANSAAVMLDGLVTILLEAGMDTLDLGAGGTLTLGGNNNSANGGTQFDTITIGDLSRPFNSIAGFE